MSISYQFTFFFTIIASLVFYGAPQDQSIITTLPISVVKATETLPFVRVEAAADSLASGIFTPNGPPNSPPIRIEAGKVCIVDLVQTYLVTGTLTGTFTIDYRIMVDGPCGKPPGTYGEKWFAHGTFNGQLNETPASGKFSYTATSKSDGEVDGRMVFDQGINGELEIKGNFNDRKLTYKGWLNE